MPSDAIVQRERDLLIRILELIEHDSPAAFVTEALAQVAGHAGAARGFIEMVDPMDPERAWSAHYGFDVTGVAQVRAVLSGTIMRETLRAGELVETASALDDARFGGAASVQRNAIEAVLCAPVGMPPLGVVYLQGHAADSRFPPEARELLVLFARHLAPVARRLLQAATPTAADPTAPWRERLGGADAFIGQSQALAELLKQAAGVAGLAVPVLLMGPSGTGKTELARLICANGPRRLAPFIEINCAALPETLVESELFGALPGAHSTATRRILGKVEAAEGGTLLFDEIGELPLPAQGKLLQLVHDGAYWPLGAAKASRADVRVIAATNRDLERAVQAGTFRSDLLHRLPVFPVLVPGLDERRGDIVALAEALLARAVGRHGLAAKRLRPSALMRLVHADWPGHIRELGNTIEAAAIRAHIEGAALVDVDHLFPPPAGVTGAAGSVLWHDAMRAFQRRLLQDSLAAHGGNVSEAAKALGIARSHAYELVRQLAGKKM